MTKIDLFEESSQAFMHIQIVLNIFRANFLITVTINKYVSIGFLVVVLLAIDDENWFRIFEESSESV